MTNSKETEKLIKNELDEKFEDDKYYLLISREDYADEFYYPIISLYKWKEIKEVLKFIKDKCLDRENESSEDNYCEDRCNVSISFWSNEEIEFDMNRVYRFILRESKKVEWCELDMAKYILNKIWYAYIDIVWWFLDWIKNWFYEFDD